LHNDFDMPAPLSIQDALDSAGKLLAACNDAPALESSVLLAHVLGISRAQLRTRPEQALRTDQQQAFFELIARRKTGEPVAYLVGHREFWSLDLIVNEHTLIPRPETELLVELALTRIPLDTEFHILDLGTGSGAIALAVASERPRCRVTASDLSPQALAVARANAERLNIANVSFREGSWLSPFGTERFDIIVANPPYVAEHDPHLDEGDLPAEPRSALVAGPTGLEMIGTIVDGAKRHMREEAWLLMEHGYNQAAMVAKLLHDAAYRQVQTWRDTAGIERVSGGQHR
jgi:release factor glutamine methyltransferase